MDKEPFDYWTFFAEEARRTGAPLYQRLSTGIAGDKALRKFADGVRAGQPSANILFAAVHFLLLRGDKHALRDYYPNLGGTRDDDPFPVFKDFVETRRAALAPLIATRVTNTNEVGRSALLAPAFRALAQEVGEPLNLIELGPSAGLNLLWDRYGVLYAKGGEYFSLGAPDSELSLECELRGDGLPPLGPAPKVASRMGLERDPVDLSDPDARDWLKALVWPDQVGRFAKLERALRLHEHVKPEIRAGNALDLLPEALASAPGDQPVCVYHTMVVYQFSAEMREALDAILVMASLRRPVWRISLEGTRSGDNPLLLYSYRGGNKEKRTLGLCHPHGTWLEWLA
ncbi:MAG: DUF2332 domain-containing protein [Alphaproteobacteria bacterium]|nr:DUF2332 domain-containing protein [Alphaproteobacteria bacterium]MDE1986051.1 DUF2332 domain-containing protein [Alphaproteobacteria bacterium]MDE2164064.1 DUF2332 domain-containing protein [Alphaproteobacteria bacterium]MDE2266836.1 DUF2332 domain-containing protein [Alphaproteobacteria bacterium]MDE2500117.1 DUF2332 domain-containing protein [Alphaproteobacteria bacterium]